jgi:hypothetical protein
MKLVALLFTAAVAGASHRTVELFFWGYGPEPLVPPGIWQLIAPNKSSNEACQCVMGEAKGCYEDFDNENHTRVLRHPVGSGPFPSQEACAEACAALGFSLAGLTISMSVAIQAIDSSHAVSAH